MQVAFSMALARLAADEPEATLAFLEKRQSLIGDGFSILHYLAAHRTAACHIYLDRPGVALASVQERWAQIVSMDHYTSVFVRAVVHSLRAGRFVGVCANA